MTEVKKYRYFTERITYRGKNLNKVKELLDGMMNDIDDRKKKNSKNQEFLEYKIVFQTRHIELTGDTDNFDSAKNRIQALISQSKGECEICCGIIQKPYVLFNCK